MRIIQSAEVLRALLSGVCPVANAEPQAHEFGVRGVLRRCPGASATADSVHKFLRGLAMVWRHKLVMAVVLCSSNGGISRQFRSFSGISGSYVLLH